MPTSAARIVTLYSVTSSTNTILNIETIERPLTQASSKIPTASTLKEGVSPAFKTTSFQQNCNRRINRSVQDWQLLIDWINKTFGDLIPPPPPPSSCLDLTLLASCVTFLLNWIESHQRITSSQGWSLFLQGDFHFQPPLPPSRPRSFSSLFFPTKLALAKEVDFKFDKARESAIDWQSFLSAFGRINEKIGVMQQDAAKSCKETAIRLLSLQGTLPSFIERKSIKFFEADSVYLSKESSSRLSTLNDRIIMGLQGTQIVIVRRTGL